MGGKSHVTEGASSGVLTCLTVCCCQRWIFAKSARRTILMAHSFIALYGLMKDSEGYGAAHCPPCSRLMGTWANRDWTTKVRGRMVIAGPCPGARGGRIARSGLRGCRGEKPHFIIANHSLDRPFSRGRGCR